MKNLISIFFFGIVISTSLGANNGLTFQKIPLGGNSYVTVRGASGSVSDAGFQFWNDTKTIFSTYFRVNREGDLQLYLEYNSDTGGNVIDVSCKNQTFTLMLPKPCINKDTVVYIGSIDNCKTGYVQVDFQGKTLKGNTFAAPSSLLVGGQASEGMNFVGDFSYYWGRRGPSVHLSYTIPAGKTAEWFYNELTVPQGEDVLGSYFMANGFGEGYFGIQVNSRTERRVLFSVWSPYNTDNPKEIPDEQKVLLVKKGKDVNTGEFGNEGSGGQSYLLYNWKAGNTYRFLTHIRPFERGYTEYTSYFYAPEMGIDCAVFAPFHYTVLYQASFIFGKFQYEHRACKAQGLLQQPMDLYSSRRMDRIDRSSVHSR